MDKLVDMIVKTLSQKDPALWVGFLAGAFGIVNVLDSLIAEQFAITWTLVPDKLRPLFTLVRDWWRPLIDVVTRFFRFEFTEPVKDYLFMGAITVGMRMRSSGVIWKALEAGTLESYPQKVLFLDKPIVLRKGESQKYWTVFLPIRLAFAFVAWPVKIVGAAVRYAGKTWREGYSEGPELEIRQQQYVTFFGAFVWAGFLTLICLVVR